MRLSNCFVLVGLTGVVCAKKSKPTEIKTLPDIVDVELTAQADNNVKITVKNLGEKQLRLFQRGNLLGMSLRKFYHEFV